MVTSIDLTGVTVILDNVRSLYNVGAVMRTCDGAGVRRMIACGITPYPPLGPNDPRRGPVADRAGRELRKTALAAMETVHVDYSPTVTEAVAQVRREGAAIIAIERAPGADLLWHAAALDAPRLALVLGHETEGLAPDVLALADAVVEIPMLGAGTSLNVAVAASVVLYELLRRRMGATGFHRRDAETQRGAQSERGEESAVTASSAPTARKRQAILLPSQAMDGPDGPLDPQAKERLTVFSGRSHPRFVDAVCRHLDHPVGQARIRTFSDGSIEVKLEENVRGRDVFIVQSGQANPNDYLMELLFLLDAARLASARSITAVLPYFPYGKGDKKDEPRVSIRARVVADTLETTGIGRVLTMDLHAPQLQGFFHVPVDNLYALPVFAAEIERLARDGTIERPVIVAPDAGRAKLAREYMDRLEALDAGVAIGDKIRPTGDERSEVTALLGDVKGRDTVMVDDIIFTGGTLCNMAEALAKAGARSVRAMVTHGLFTGDAMARIEASPLAQVIVTDTVPPPRTIGGCVRRLSVAPLFAEAIRSIVEQTSISRLFA